MSKPRYNVNESTFRYMYLARKKSGMEMSGIFHVSRSTISRWLKYYNIPERSISESLTGIKRSPETKQKMSNAHKR